jgi:putative transposase
MHVGRIGNGPTVGRTSCTRSRKGSYKSAFLGTSGRSSWADLSGIRDDENGDSIDWGDHGNLDLHGWAFDRFTSGLEYKAEAEGIDVQLVSERDTSKCCSTCGRKHRSNRVERGLYVCDECGLVANADTNGAENIRNGGAPESPSGDRDNGWLAQPAVRLSDRTRDRFSRVNRRLRTTTFPTR